MVLALMVLGVIADVSAPATLSVSAKPAISLRPFKPLSLNALRAAVRAQEGPHSEPLKRAWGYYEMFQGSWKPKAPKPQPADVAAFDALKAELERSELPAWFARLLDQPVSTISRDRIDPSSPAFAELRQNRETERIKALGLVYLTEHELDRPGTAEKGARTLSSLLGRTPLDDELHNLLARFLADAKQPKQALEEARMSLYLNPRPRRHDLSFAAFIGFTSARGGWELIQAMLREAAINSDDAEAVICEWDPRFKGNSETVVLPLVPTPR